MPDTSKKTLSGVICEVLSISDARQKATAHIESNSVDLALDMARHYTKTQLPVDFYHDWLGVADDEARHL